MQSSLGQLWVRRWTPDPNQVHISSSEREQDAPLTTRTGTCKGGVSMNPQGDIVESLIMDTSEKTTGRMRENESLDPAEPEAILSGLFMQNQ